MSAKAAKTHRHSHLLATGGLLASAAPGALISDLGQYLPDATRTLRTGKLEPAVVRAEQTLGLSEASGASLLVPAFYQPLQTVKKSTGALKKPRRGTGDDDTPLGELVERLRMVLKTPLATVAETRYSTW